MLAIAGGKGGTGKTTTALGLATVLGAARERPTGRTGGTGAPGSGVLVVDADVDVPDLHAMAGVPREPTVLDDPDGLAVPERPGVRVAPAPPPTAPSAFRDRLRVLAAPDHHSDHNRPRPGRVLVDAPCGAGPDAALPMAVADAALLVTRPTVAAVRDTAKTAAMARALDTPIAAVAVVESTAGQPSAVEGSTTGQPSAVEGSTTGQPSAVEGSTSVRSLSDVFDVDDVVRVPSADDDPLADAAHGASMRRLVDALSAGQTPF
jgi:septum site-determining protein MinD